MSKKRIEQQEPKLREPEPRPPDVHDGTQQVSAEQFSLRYLFFVTTSVALGACLFGQSQFPTPVRALGLSMVLYWISKAFFVGSTRLPSVAREIVFLLGLPFYLSSVLTLIGTTISIVMRLLGRA